MPNPEIPFDPSILKSEPSPTTDPALGDGTEYHSATPNGMTVRVFPERNAVQVIAPGINVLFVGELAPDTRVDEHGRPWVRLSRHDGSLTLYERGFRFRWDQPESLDPGQGETDPAAPTDAQPASLSPGPTEAAPQQPDRATGHEEASGTSPERRPGRWLSWTGNLACDAGISPESGLVGMTVSEHTRGPDRKRVTTYHRVYPKEELNDQALEWLDAGKLTTGARLEIGGLLNEPPDVDGKPQVPYVIAESITILPRKQRRTHRIIVEGGGT
jgi:hypothetical protein